MKHHLEKHAILYRMSPHFKHAVDTIMPLILDALARQAREIDHEMEERMIKLMEQSSVHYGAVWWEDYLEEKGGKDEHT